MKGESILRVWLNTAGHLVNEWASVLEREKALTERVRVLEVRVEFLDELLTKDSS